jgi:hypothetical protein
VRRATVWKAAAAVAVLGVMCAVGAITYINHSRPQALGLASVTPRTPAPSPSPEDPLVAACPKPPASVPPPGSTFTGLWIVQPGSMAGYRAHEKFLELTSPHDAVARTDRLAGWLVIGGSDATPVLVAGCVAVDVRTLESVDELPGFNVSDRDKIARDFLGAYTHPFVVFQPHAIDLRLSGSTAAVQHVALPGDLDIGGVILPATFKLDVRVKSGTVAVAGQSTVNAQQFGVEVPTEAGGFVRVNPQIILEVSLVLLKP